MILKDKTNMKQNTPSPISTRSISSFLSKEMKKRPLDEILSELLSERELTEISNRIEIIKQLEAGKNQRQVANDVGVGIATVTRGAKIIKQRQERAILDNNS